MIINRFHDAGLESQINHFGWNYEDNKMSV